MTSWQFRLLGAAITVALCASSIQAMSHPAQFHYDEESVPSYLLPDPLRCEDGTPVHDQESWSTRRRSEILELFRSQVYGRAAHRGTTLRVEVMEEGRAPFGPDSWRRQLRLHLAPECSIDLLVYLPQRSEEPHNSQHGKTSSPRPSVPGADAGLPAILALNFYGNASVHEDPAIRLNDSWMSDNRKLGIVNHRATNRTRGARARRWDIEAILARGFAFCTVHYGDIDPDFDDGFENGIHGALTPRPESRSADAWGSIAAWAFGLSRCLDYLEQEPAIDASRVAVMGHSRLGKTALWAGASDERFALVISNNSGCGGAALSRREFGETVARINQVFPHWFCRNFHAYGADVHSLPVDQHMLIALIAPRPVYVASATKDLWADPRGEFLSVKHAEPVYDLYGLPGLPADEPPEPNESSQGTLGYHIRAGKHDVTSLDWAHYLDFAARHLLAEGQQQQR